MVERARYFRPHQLLPHQAVRTRARCMFVSTLHHSLNHWQRVLTCDFQSMQSSCQHIFHTFPCTNRRTVPPKIRTTTDRNSQPRRSCTAVLQEIVKNCCPSALARRWHYSRVAAGGCVSAHAFRIRWRKTAAVRQKTRQRRKNVCPGGTEPGQRAD